MFNTLAVKANRAGNALRGYAAKRAAAAEVEGGAFDKLIVTIVLVAAAVIIGGAVIAWFRTTAGTTGDKAESAISSNSNFSGVGVTDPI